MSGKPRIRLEGRTFGKWEVISLSSRDKSGAHWVCRCACGTTRVVVGHSLTSGKSASCGCEPKQSNGIWKHGNALAGNQTPEYRTWVEMRKRCNDAENADYGGRGIKVCERWDSSFENFLADMGPRPDGMSIERDDVNGIYEPSNCRWATRVEQNNNKRTSRIYEINGKRKTVAQWSQETGISQQLIYHRVRLGWSPEDAIFTPPNNKITGRPAA